MQKMSEDRMGRKGKKETVWKHGGARYGMDEA